MTSPRMRAAGLLLLTCHVHRFRNCLPRVESFSFKSRSFQFPSQGRRRIRSRNVPTTKERCHGDQNRGTNSRLLKIPTDRECVEAEKSSEPMTPVPSSHTEGTIREVATLTLSRVFYPPHQNVEKALKKTMRRQSGGGDDGIAMDSNSRKRLSDLTLGTSVMRLRHWCDLVSSDDANDAVIGRTILGVEDRWFDSRIKSQNRTFPPLDEIGDGALTRHDIRTVRALVDLHAQYLERREIEDPPEKEPFTLTTAASNDNHDEPALQLSFEQSLPPFLCRLLISQYGMTQAVQISDISNRPGPITLRLNSLKCPTPQKLASRLIEENDIHIASFPHALSPQSLRLSPPKPKSIWNIQAWKDGWFEVQDLGSQCVVQATEAVRNETVIDYCAGNGGKTFALASLMKRGRIVAYDVDDARLAQLRGSLGRVLGPSPNSDVGVEGVRIETTDMEGGLPRDADLVLVDAPCSSTGVLRRRPSQRWMLEEEDVLTKFPNLQYDILCRASRLVRKGGGRLVYATCSILRQENEDVVKRFEETILPHGWERWDFSDDETDVGWATMENQNWRAILPHLQDGCDGFFVARWKQT